MVAFNPVVVSIPITFHAWSSMHDNFESWFDSSVWEGSEQTLNLHVRMRVGMKAFIISFRRDCEYMRIEVSRHLLCVQVLIF